jgi:hypothetical protein
LHGFMPLNPPETEGRGHAPPACFVQSTESGLKQSQGRQSEHEIGSKDLNGA